MINEVTKEHEYGLFSYGNIEKGVLNDQGELFSYLLYQFDRGLFGKLAGQRRGTSNLRPLKTSTRVLK